MLIAWLLHPFSSSFFVLLLKRGKQIRLRVFFPLKSGGIDAVEDILKRRDFFFAEFTFYIFFVFDRAQFEYV